MFYYVYVLESFKNGSLYIGFSRDIVRRIREHNQGKVPSTSQSKPWKLIHYLAYRNQRDALRREQYLKTNQGSRLLKRMLKEYFYEKKEKARKN